MKNKIEEKENFTGGNRLKSYKSKRFFVCLIVIFLSIFFFLFLAVSSLSEDEFKENYIETCLEREYAIGFCRCGFDYIYNNLGHKKYAMDRVIGLLPLPRKMPAVYVEAVYYCLEYIEIDPETKQNFRAEFMSSCNREHIAYCECAFEYMIQQKGIEQIIKIAIADNITGEISAIVRESRDYCLDYLP